MDHNTKEKKQQRSLKKLLFLVTLISVGIFVVPSITHTSLVESVTRIAKTLIFSEARQWQIASDAPGDFSASSTGFTFDPAIPLVDNTTNISIVVHNNGDDYSSVASSTEQKYEGSADANYAVHVAEFLAESFNPDYDFILDKVQLYIRAAGTCGTLTVDIRTNSGTVPSSTTLASATRTTCSPSSNAWVDFEFDEYPTLTNGTTYWIVLKGDGADNSNCWSWATDNTSPSWTQGNYAYDLDGAPEGWTASTAYDGLFKVFSSDGPAIDVSFFDDDPSSGGTQIGATTTIAAIGASATTSTNVNWVPTATGTYDIYVVIDKDGLITESDETNNTASTSITVYAPPILYQNHYRWRDDTIGLNATSTASWYAAEDTAATTTVPNDIIRLRVNIANTGAGISTDYKYELEYAERTGSTCGDESFITMPVSTTTGPFEMATSTQYANLASTTVNILTGSSTLSWANGYAVEDPSATTSPYTIATNTYTEFEYAIKMTGNASTSDKAFCFRLTNNGTTANFNYSVYPELQYLPSSSAPTTLYVGYPSAQSGSSNPTNATSTTPFFSAINNHDISVTAVQIQVATSTFNNIMWDSGELTIPSAVNATRTSDVFYGMAATGGYGTSSAPLLEAGKNYIWRIRTKGNISYSPWSATGTIGMAFSGSFVSRFYEDKDTKYGTVFGTDGAPDGAGLSMGGWGDYYYAFLEWNLSLSPSSTSTTQCTLNWYPNEIPVNDPTGYVRVITESWVEADVCLADNPTSITTDQVLVPKPTSISYKTLDISTIYEKWKDGTNTNYGIKHVPTTTGASSNYSVRSSDHAWIDYDPYLEVVYSATGTSITASGTVYI
ncbi:MAG: hypothetical protein KAS07_04185, partial [Candidatus Pacebacteria bacterium]|nr:hypothetical protein [Candidatus Paceibacterota bacterium]